MTERPEQSDPAAGPLAAKVVKGAGVLVGANVAVKILSLVGLAVLARLLTPEDYGVMTIAMLAVALGDQLSQIKITQVLIRLPALEPSHYTTAFTLNLIRGCLIGLAVFVSADWVAALFGEPEVAQAMRWLALAPALRCLSSPRMVDFTRRLDYRQEGVVSILAKLVSMSAAIKVALSTGDYRALIVGAITLQVITAIATHVAAPWRPRLGFAHARMFLGFGAWMTASGTVRFANNRASAALIGGLLGAPALGQYEIGEQIATATTRQIAFQFTRAVFSGLSRVAAQEARLRQAYFKAQSTTLGVFLPLSVGMSLAADEIVLLFAGPQWTEAALVLKVVAPTVGLTMIIAGVHALLIVDNNPRSVFIRDIQNAAVQIPLLVAGIWRYGLEGLLAAMVCGALFIIWNNLRVVSARTGVSTWTPVARAWRTFASTAAMAAALLLLDLALPVRGTDITANLLSLSAKAALGLTVCAGTQFALWRLAGSPDGFESAVMDVAARLLRKRGG